MSTSFNYDACLSGLLASQKMLNVIEGSGFEAKEYAREHLTIDENHFDRLEEIKKEISLYETKIKRLKAEAEEIFKSEFK